MSEDRVQIAKDYFQGKPFDPSLGSVVRDSNPWGRNTGHGLSPRRGTFRYWYDPDQLYSYQMPLICRIQRKGSDFYILNGDGPPSKMTNGHQRSLRKSVNEELLRSKWAIIPFSALDNARIRVTDVEVVDTIEDKEITRQELCRSARCPETAPGHTHPRTLHFLGETLFRVKRDRAYIYYVCGMDRNDNPMRRMFFLAQIPKTRTAPKTIDEALNSLRPAFIPPDSPRQGEWFFQRVALRVDTMTEIEWHKALGLKKSDKVTIRVEKTEIAPLVEPVRRYGRAERGEMAWARSQQDRDSHFASLDGRTQERRHYASKIVHVTVTSAAGKEERTMYVKGQIKDAEHDTLMLKGWHKVVKNLAVRGWRAGGNGTGAQVD